jgi:hypothetical protein
VDKISIIHVKECYINYVSLRNIVPDFTNVTMLTISASTSLQMNTELLCACDPAEGYPLLSTNSSQPSLRQPIDPGILSISLMF